MRLGLDTRSKWWLEYVVVPAAIATLALVIPIWAVLVVALAVLTLLAKSKKKSELCELAHEQPPRSARLEWHHVVPVALGGRSDASNLVLMDAESHRRLDAR